MSTERWDVIIAGAGPAGLSLASACAERGLRTLCIAPDVHKRWENNFGTWVDEVAPVGLADVFSETWPKAIVQFDDTHQVRLDRAYGRVDAEKLRRTLRARAGALLTEREGRVLSVAHDSTGSEVRLEAGETLRSRVLVDATGFNSSLIERKGKAADALQVAYGVMAKVKRHPYALDEMGFMDFRDSFLPSRKGPPTFLYAMPFSADRVFLEETSLVSRPPMSIETLRERLDLRLAALGIEVLEVEWEERCFIPMNGPVPRLDQRTLGFGAAAGFVHPGSGFSVSLSLSLAPRVADSLAASLARPDASPAAAVRDAWGAVWTKGRLRTRAAHMAGMEIFVRSGAPGLRRFLGLFFKAPDAFWKGYLSGNRSPGELARAWTR